MREGDPDDLWHVVRRRGKRAEQLAFHIHWRYDEDDNPYARTNADFAQAKDAINKLTRSAFHETSDMINQRERYDDHTDEAWLALYRVPQFGICLGKLNGENVCGAVVRVIAGKCMRVVHTDARDITVAEITCVCAVPQAAGHGSQLMQYLVQALKPKFDALELKVETKSDDLYEVWDFDDADAEDQKELARRVAENALKNEEKAQEAARLVAFYRKSGFETHACQCDRCRWSSQNSTDTPDHVEMVHRLGKTDGTILLPTEVEDEYGPETRDDMKNRGMAHYTHGQKAVRR